MEENVIVCGSIFTNYKFSTFWSSPNEMQKSVVFFKSNVKVSKKLFYPSFYKLLGIHGSKWQIVKKPLLARHI